MGLPAEAATSEPATRRGCGRRLLVAQALRAVVLRGVALRGVALRGVVLRGVALRVAALLLAGAALSVQAGNIYKYTDARGRTVFNAVMPPEFVQNGYTILNERGQVLQVVPRAPTPAERAARAAEEQARLAAEEAARQQQETDAMLRGSYRSVQELLEQRDLRVARLDRRLAELTRQLQSAGADRQSLQNEITVVEAEKQEEIATAERNARRLQELLGAAEQAAGQ